MKPRLGLAAFVLAGVLLQSVASRAPLAVAGESTAETASGDGLSASAGDQRAATSRKDPILQQEELFLGPVHITRVVTGGEDYELLTAVERYEGTIVKKTYGRTTLSKGKKRRKRVTVVPYGRDGPQRFETRLFGHWGKGDFWGQLRFVVDSEDVQRYLASKGRPLGPNPDNPGEACGLDDPQQVPDEDLLPYASTIYESYDETGRILYVKGGRSIAAGTKFVYGETPPFSAGNTGSDDLNTVRSFRRSQPVDAKGMPTAGFPRRVQFIGDDSLIDLFEVTQQMDYSSGPRPAIVHCTVFHRCYFRDPVDNRLESLVNPVPREELVLEREDVTMGDPALQGEWITAVRLKNPDAVRQNTDMKRLVAESQEKDAQASLKEAQLLEQRRLLDAARATYHRIIQYFPETKAAEVARQRLEALKK